MKAVRSTANKTANWHRMDCWQNDCWSFQRDCGNGNTLIDVRSMGAAGFFSGWAIRGSERRKTPRGPGAELRWESGGSKSWHFLKITHKYFVYWDFRQHLQHKKHFIQHFQWRNKCPLAHACGLLWYEELIIPATLEAWAVAVVVRSEPMQTSSLQPRLTTGLHSQCGRHISVNSVMFECSKHFFCRVSLENVAGNAFDAFYCAAWNADAV